MTEIGNSQVLLIDDDAGVRESFGGFLRLRGFDVEVAETGRDALALLRRRRFDAAIVDIALPDMSGLELLSPIKRQAEDAEVVFITGHASLPTALQAIDGDAFAYLVKPFQMEHLVTTLAKALEKQRLARDLRESESRYRLVTDTMPDGIFMMDLEGRIVFTNPAAAVLTGYTERELLGRSIFSAMHPETAQEAGRQLDAIADRREPITFFEGPIQRKDGALRSVEASVASIVREGQVVGRLAVWRDITSRRELEAQLFQAQKLEAVGRLAGGIAHDFNNLLTVVNGRSMILLNLLAADDPRRRHAELIASASDRGAAMTAQLLAFSRTQILQPRVVDLNAILTDLKPLLSRLVRADVELHLVMDPGSVRVKADPSQIEQIVMNLAINASDAMREGGRLTFETGNVELDEAQVQGRPELAAGSYVVLTATDTGMGMDPETQRRIFEPFFTTKEPGKGTGLGLATVQGIVKQSGGSVAVTSEVGRGTSFRVYLPRVVEPRGEHEEAPPPVVSSGGSETVLLADDDDVLRDLLREVLQNRGYTVLEARDGAAALALSRGYPDRIHAVVSDIVMPGTGGRQLVNALLGERPGLKALLLSGYTDETLVLQGMLSAGTAYLQKPFTPDTFLLKVREVLDAL